MAFIDITKHEKGVPKKMALNGKPAEPYDTYLIPLDLLYYNDLNGRIVTDVQEYDSKNEETLEELLERNRADYNKEVAEIIKKSPNYKTTKDDIELNNQLVQGVILDDGRIIDGNRRYTCLVDLYKETGDARYSKFECVVLPTPEEGDKDKWKNIKELEISLQNADPKRDYDPIDALADFYRNCLDPEGTQLTDKEYARYSGKKDYAKQKKCVEIMIDYLEWRQQPKAWYIVKNEKLDGQIVEISNKFSVNDARFQEIKDDIYTAMTLAQGDRPRELRPLLESAKKKTALYDVFSKDLNSGDNTKLMAKAVKYKDTKSNDPNETKEMNEVINEAIKQINYAYSAADYQDEQEKVKTGPVKNVELAINNLKKIDIPSLKTLDEIQKVNLNKEIDELEDISEKIKNGTRY